MKVSFLSNFRTLSSPSKKPTPSSSYSPFSLILSLSAMNLFSLSMDLLVWTFYINGLIQYVVLCDWLLSLSIMLSRFILVGACVSTSFLFWPNNSPLNGCSAFCLSIYYMMHICSYLHVLATMNNTAINSHVQIFLGTYLVVELPVYYNCLRK